VKLKTSRAKRSTRNLGGPGKGPSAPRRGGSVRSRHLFEHWASVGRRLRAANKIALFLDFDGTLAPICLHPDEVKIPLPTRHILRRLARHPRVNLYVISGRRVADVRRHVRIHLVTYLGLHGWERSNGKLRESETFRFMQRLRREVEKEMEGLEGIWVQDKSIVFVVHYRRAGDAARRRARAVLGSILAKVASRVRLMEGKKIWEILPVELKGKGAAVLTLLRESRDRLLPIYLGDDTTDEAAFEALPHGITVRVGTPRPTRARYELLDPDEVKVFLEKLEAEIA
jgi:trehalose 6-phosphate phosphatase